MNVYIREYKFSGFARTFEIEQLHIMSFNLSQIQNSLFVCFQTPLDYFIETVIYKSQKYACWVFPVIVKVQ